MKTIILLLLASAVLAPAFTGRTIAPVVVYVVDEAGKPVPGATVKVLKSGLEGFIEQELDPKSEFRALAIAAARPVRTNALGMALCYCGGGWLPVAGKGRVSALRGTVEVIAPGFQKSSCQFDRELSSDPDGATELVLQITITLRRGAVKTDE